MARTMILFLLLLILIVTTQFRWWHKIAGRTGFYKQHQVSDIEADLEDSIVLMQEKTINKLNELVQNLKEQLQICRSSRFGPAYYVIRKNHSKFAPT
ncbi:hypothetical protein F511_23060 [Dorcoceras hygrometricum]|uniref:Uncharacterized protein n=1 Tax=Dorcoceras hygrometricum TaxID=472368 RepID=A0A2Z7A780_9LAMI|nr:hypothetical protein F511_23060 [Dorcoceras hygrometricum]